MEEVRRVAGVAAHVERALGQDRARFWAIGDGDQHCGGARIASGKLLVCQQVGQFDPVALVEDRPQAIDQFSVGGVHGFRRNVSPMLETPQSSPFARACSASCW